MPRPFTDAYLFDTCFPLVVLVLAVGFDDTRTGAEGEDVVAGLIIGAEDVGACLREPEISLAAAAAAAVPGRGVAPVVEEELRAEVKEWPFERWRLVGIDVCRMDNRAPCATAGAAGIVVGDVVEEVYDS